MKFTIQCDCTPEEARTFCGLPDLKPIQEAISAKMQQQMLDAMSPEAMQKYWMPYMTQLPEQFQEAFMRFFRMANRTTPTTTSQP